MSSKKEAAESLTRLRDYLKRDEYGVRLITAVEKFIGELRRERSDLKSQIDNLTAAVESNKITRDIAEHRAAEASSQVDGLVVRIKSLERDVARSDARLEEVLAKYEPPADGVTCSTDDAVPDVREFVRVGTRLMSRMPRHPESNELVKVIENFSDHAYMTLGLYAVWSCLLHGSFSLTYSGPTFADMGGAGAKVPERFVSRTVRWMKNVIADEGGVIGQIASMRAMIANDAAARAMHGAAVRGADQRNIGCDVKNSLV